MHDLYPENNNRKAAVAGSFYPSEKDTLKEEVKTLLDQNRAKSIPGRVRALLVPHAGYIYSGATAAAAYNSLLSMSPYKAVFIIGSSHRHRFKGASVSKKDNFLTPLGRAKINKTICSGLIESSTVFSAYDEAHTEEHSLEVQLPFLQYIFGDELTIVPLLTGSSSQSELLDIAKHLYPYFNNDYLFIISSDFSHYPAYKEAVKLDNETINEFIESDPDTFAGWILDAEAKKKNGAHTPMCGWCAGMILKHLYSMALTDKNNLKYIHLNYSNSGDSRFGDKNGVVGYHALALVNNESGDAGFDISRDNRKKLLALARENISMKLNTGKFLNIDSSQYSSDLKQQLGAFVTLRVKKKLRGCIGSLNPTGPLYETIKQMSIAAAFTDTRFDPLKPEELSELEIEISVLGPKKKISSAESIIPGRHGVLMVHGTRSATFLPQVASEQGWNTEQLLGHLSRDKAGLAWDTWKEAELYIYEAVVFAEGEK